MCGGKLHESGCVGMERYSPRNAIDSWGGTITAFKGYGMCEGLNRESAAIGACASPLKLKICVPDLRPDRS